MTVLLALLYPLAIQYERGGVWLVVLPITFIALLIDVAANYTELALVTWDFPRKGEHTFSQRLYRLVRTPGWRREVCIPVANVLNWIAPDGQHIHMPQPAQAGFSTS